MSEPCYAYTWKHSKQKRSKPLVLLAIAFLADDEGECLVTTKRLRKMANMSEGRVRKIVAELKNSGELAVISGYGAYKSAYYLNDYRQSIGLRAIPSGVRVVEGYAYLIQRGTLYKIGCTKEPKNRIQKYRRYFGYPVDFLSLIHSPSMFNLEARLHKEFSHRHVRGEWFDLSSKDVAYIIELGENIS